MLGDTIILTLTEALSEGNLKVHINNSITENPIQDYAGNILSDCEITFNYVKTGDTSSQVTVKKADQDMVTLSFSKPVTATDLKLFHTNESMASNMSTPVSINKGTFVAEITFEFPDKIPVGTTDFFLVNSSDPSCKAFNIYGEYVPDQTLVADVTPEKNPPYVTKSELINNNTYKIYFNEQVSKSFAENPANYDFKTFDNYTTVSFLPTLSNDSKSVELYLPQGLRDNTKYNVVVRNAEDISGNKTASDIQLEFTNGEHSSPSVEVNKCRTNNNEGKIIIYFSEPMNEAQMLDKASYKVATTPDAIYASLGTGDKISKLSDRSVLIEMSKTVNSPSVMLAPIMDLSGTRLYNSIAPVYIKDIKEEILSVESANLIAKNKVKVTFSRILQSFNADDISFTGVTSGEISVQNIESMINNDKDKTEVVLVLNKELSTDVKYNGSVVSAVTKEDCNSMSALGCKLSPSQTISINDMVAPELIKYDHDSNPLTEPVEKVVLSGNILTSMVDGKVAKNTTGTITLSFSEPILEFSLSVLTFAVEGYTVTSISNAVNKNEVVLSIKANANNTPAITTVRQNNNISDYSGNILLLDKVLQVR